MKKDDIGTIDTGKSYIEICGCRHLHTDHVVTESIYCEDHGYTGKQLYKIAERILNHD